jgi:hypothetical protein
MTAHWQKLNGGTATEIAICPLLAPALPSFCPRVTIKHVAQKHAAVLRLGHAQTKLLKRGRRI